MNYTHPTITVLEPDPGHFVVRGHATPYSTEGGTVCPLEVCDIPPGVPSELLQAILGARGFVDVEPAATLEEMGTFETIRELRAANADLRTEIDSLRGYLKAAHEEIAERNRASVAIPVITEGDRAKFAEDSAPPKNKGGRPRKVQPETTEAAQ